MKNVYVAIMAGGIGSRFWPKSRENHPKQFLDILGIGKSLLQSTYERMLQLIPKEHIYIITNRYYFDLARQQLPDIHPSQIITEPARKNTAPCIAYMAHKIATIDRNAIMIVAPSDHLITKENRFYDTLKSAVRFARLHHALITLGIRPTRPDTGYGYIQYIEDSTSAGVQKVKTFTEKPNLQLAKTFIKSGDFLWNSGIFIWSVKSILKAFRTLQPEMHEIFSEGKKLYNTPAEEKFIQKAYSLCTNISIDYGIMEKAPNVFVIPADFGWSDLGTWNSLHEVYDKDYLNNAVSGKNVFVVDARNCMIVAPNDKLVVLQGLEDFIIIDTIDVLLICKRSYEQDIKHITAEIKKKKKKREKYL